MSSPLASGRAAVNARGMQIALEHVYLTVTDLDRTLAYYRAFFPEWVVRWEGKSSAGRWVHFGPPGDGQPGYLSLAEDPRAAPMASRSSSCRSCDHEATRGPREQAAVDRQPAHPRALGDTSRTAIGEEPLRSLD